MRARIKVERKADGKLIFTPQVNNYNLLERLLCNFISFVMFGGSHTSFWQGLYIVDKDDKDALFFGSDHEIGEYDTCFGEAGLKFINDKEKAEEAIHKYKEQVLKRDRKIKDEKNALKVRQLEAKRIKKLEKTYYIKLVIRG